MSTDWLNVLKYLGTATAAMYAVYQLFLDYRDKRSGTPSDPERHAKRLTIALGFVAVGALISLFGDIGKDLR
ncbi:MAG TPA: hypothetical protein VFS20_01400, partial [Longimicrobium sp.]|nr:hypothetical protein [Longimicrobium sp.]